MASLNGVKPSLWSLWNSQNICNSDIFIYQIRNFGRYGRKPERLFKTHVIQDTYMSVSMNHAPELYFLHWDGHTSSIPKHHWYDLRCSQVLGHFESHSRPKHIMSIVEAFRDTNLRSLLRELRTDIAMAVGDPFPLVYGLADKNIISDQLLKVSGSIFSLFAF